MHSLHGGGNRSVLAGLNGNILKSLLPLLHGVFPWRGTDGVNALYLLLSSKVPLLPPLCHEFSVFVQGTAASPGGKLPLCRYIHVPFGKGWQVLTLLMRPQLWMLSLETPGV